MGFVQETISLIVTLFIVIFSFFLFLPLIAESLNTSSLFSYALGFVLVIAIAIVFIMNNIVRR